ncbi:unnamed protein product [Linum tenue]|uniref:Uncharacterized protein n=1 Tax=Linum tenue TaxID=586396 RepID=A0AAV0IPG8_9ROSI|nr:unnamed protein product [Linum tenue]
MHQPTSAVGFSPISPSFNSYSTSSDETLAEIAVRVVQELSLGDGDDSALDFYSWEEPDQNQEEEEEEDEAETTPHHGQSSSDDEEEEEFEFAVVGREAVASPISADEIFYNGQIRPLYPLFNTDLLLFDSKAAPAPAPAKPVRGRRPQLKKLFKQEEGGDGSDTDSSEELEGLPEGTYCVWNPKKPETAPEIRKKSKSTGNDSKRWKFRDLLYRSHSDGKDSFVFLAPKKAAAAGGGDKIKGGEKELKEGGEKQKRYVKKDGEQRRRPYRQDAAGLFSNISGVSRNLHPF